MVGIVGKPNAGKSTFFSAATLIQVPIANYPFTTIKPNRGIAYVTAKCPCKEFGVKDDPANSICDEGTRLIPVELVDCAGLVPDAWKGRGLGNRFLDEIRRADAMIHVVDASGSTDLEGRPCPPGSHDPVEDVDFLMREIDMWLFQIVKRDWREISKGKDARSGLEAKLSGLSIGRSHIDRAISDSGLEHKRLAEW
ncbi:MAG: GTPase, partial [Candidatus Bathyarchaeia archaeon]